MSRCPSVLLAALLALGACAKAAVLAGPPKLRCADYHPLAVGNRWTYAGTVMGQPVEKTVTITQKRGDYFADDAGALLKIDSQGLRDLSRYLLKEPIERGKTWTAVVSLSSTERFEITEVGATAQTPAGTFNDCVRVRASSPMGPERMLAAEWTFAPNVGIVSIRTSAAVGGREIPQTALELKSYELAKP